MENPLGEKILAQKNLTPAFLKQCYQQLSFHTICSRDPDMPSGCLVHPLPAARIDDCGFYFVREHAPDGTNHCLAYLGMSRDRLKTTAKCHFWSPMFKSDYNPLTHNMRGEIKGDWINKVANQGYRYDIAVMVLVPPVLKSGIKQFNDRLFQLETLLIEALNPRDNTRKKPGSTIIEFTDEELPF